MRAFTANGKPIRLDMHEQNWFAESVTRDELARTHTTGLDPFCEVGTGQLVGVIAHFR
jgi:hypothetical protein